MKKDEFIKTKTDLNKRKSDFGRKGNNWIEPLRNWINTAHHAEKLALSNDFYEIKSLTEKIGTNHQLFNKIIEWKLKIPYAILREYNEKISIAEAAFGGRSGAFQSIKKDQSFVWSGRQDSNLRPHRPKRRALPTALLPDNDEIVPKNHE